MPDNDDFKDATPERLAKALLRPIKKAAEGIVRPNLFEPGS